MAIETKDVKDLVSVESSVLDALSKVAESKTNKLTQTEAAKIAPAVAKKVEAEVTSQIKPVIEHLTNNEPWYQSRVTIGALVAALAGLAGLAGYSIDSDDQAFLVDNISQTVQLVTALASLAGGVLAWYGRWKAKKPLGS